MTVLRWIPWCIHMSWGSILFIICISLSARTPKCIAGSWDCFTSKNAVKSWFSLKMLLGFSQSSLTNWLSCVILAWHRKRMEGNLFNLPSQLLWNCESKWGRRLLGTNWFPAVAMPERLLITSWGRWWWPAAQTGYANSLLTLMQIATFMDFMGSPHRADMVVWSTRAAYVIAFIAVNVISYLIRKVPGKGSSLL